MRSVKRLLIALATLLVLLPVAGYGTFLYLARPERFPVRPKLPDYSAMNLDRVVGGYQFAPSDGALVTCAAGGGLQLVHLGGAFTKL